MKEEPVKAEFMEEADDYKMEDSPDVKSEPDSGMSFFCHFVSKLTFF